jgi:hypothetical protein
MFSQRKAGEKRTVGEHASQKAAHSARRFETRFGKGRERSHRALAIKRPG